MSDQFVSGKIDEYGQFRGTVRVYDKEFPNHIISWKDGGGKPTECGPFRVEFGYLQGNQRETMADLDEWAKLNQKLEKLGGLYVYRDRIRILPYGNSDVDWLDIELRRNKGMGYYFFSYRRTYGAVCLTKESNAELREKAGREGFQKGKAYRQFKNVLENLFIQSLYQKLKCWSVAVWKDHVVCIGVLEDKRGEADCSMKMGKIYIQLGNNNEGRDCFRSVLPKLTQLR